MTSKNKKSVLAITIICIVAIVGLATFFIIKGLKGETTIAGKFPDNITSNSIKCTTRGISYPFFTQDNSTSKTTEVDIVFNGNALNSISLKHILYYTGIDQSKASEASNHASMNRSFGSEFGADAFRATYYVDESMMRMTLYATRANFNDASSKYFLLDSAYKKRQDFIANYKEQGFNCVEQ